MADRHDERAAELVSETIKDMLTGRSAEGARERIATALREVERLTIERCAGVADEAARGASGLPTHAHAMRQCAAAIRDRIRSLTRL